MTIKLTKNNSFKWKKQESIYIKSSLINEEDILLKKPLSLENDNVKTYLNDIEGFFSLVYENDTHILAACDYHRMFPLFYSIVDGEIIICDEILCFKDYNFDLLSKTEFTMSGYVTGNKTLYENVFQLQAGEYLLFDKDSHKLKVEDYIEYDLENNVLKSPKEELEYLDDLHIDVFSELIAKLNGRAVIVPLSGGYDSRIIVNMLSRLKYKNVICFSYGVLNNWESMESKKIADSLGFEWHFISYDEQKWKKFRGNNSYKQFMNYSGEGFTAPHILDVIAVDELNKNNIIPKDSVFLPGHTGFLSFSQFPEKINRDEINLNLYKKHYMLWPEKGYNRSHIDLIKKRLKDSTIRIMDKDYKPEDTLYIWEKNERHSKFICNSVRTYEMNSFKWALPLWDKRLVEFWLTTSHEKRINKILIKEYFHLYLEDYNNKLKTPNYKSNNILVKKMRDLLHKKVLLYSLSKKILKVKEYNSHPMEWYKMFSKKEYYTRVLKGAVNINSFISIDYLESIKKSKVITPKK